MEEVKSMGLKYLPIMHQTTHLFTGRGETIRPDSYNHIDSLGSGKVMAHRTDSAETLHKYRSFPVGTPLDESFETSELYYMQPALSDFVVIIEVDSDFTVSFNPGNRFDSIFLDILLS